MIFNPALHEYWTDDHLVRIPGVTTMARLEPSIMPYEKLEPQIILALFQIC